MSQPETGWVSRWVVSLCEPLLDTESRIEIEAGMVSVIAANPHWVAAWASGWLSDIVLSLDPEDPWRALVITDGQVRHPDGTPFGSWVDTTDIVHASTEDIRSDLGLAAVRQPLEEKAAQLLAVSVKGRDDALHWCEQNIVSAPVLGPDDANAFFRTIAEALRWAIFRRRLFEGAEDPFIPVTGIEWIHRAQKVITGEAWDEARAARFLKTSSIDAGTYGQFT